MSVSSSCPHSSMCWHCCGLAALEVIAIQKRQTAAGITWHNVMRCDESLAARSGSLEIGEMSLIGKACVDHVSAGLVVDVACFSVDDSNAMFRSPARRLCMACDRTPDTTPRSKRTCGNM